MNFLPVVGFEGLYVVSDCGKVRSLDRRLRGSDGNDYERKGQWIQPKIHKITGYYTVDLWKFTKRKRIPLHRVVAQAFIPNPEDKPEVNHIDGNKSHNAVMNLEWCTRSENMQHAVRTNLRTYTNRLTEEEFTECLKAVIDGESYSSLAERTPYKTTFLSVKLRKLAQKLGVEDLLDSSLRDQRIRRARENGNKNNGDYQNRRPDNRRRVQRTGDQFDC